MARTFAAPEKGFFPPSFPGSVQHFCSSLPSLDAPRSTTTSCYASPSPYTPFTLLPVHTSAATLPPRDTPCSATTSRYASMCHQRRLTQDVDVVFIEFAVNDPSGPHTSMERLIRKVLQYPNRYATCSVQHGG